MFNVNKISEDDVINNLDEKFEQYDVQETKKKWEETKKKNESFRHFMERINKSIIVELDDITFKLKPITVKMWADINGDIESIKNQSKLVFLCMEYPKLTEEEFLTIPAPIVSQLYLLLFSNFFELMEEIPLI